MITLGIIGIVAALTMPALVASYRKHVVETALKRFYTNMNQAVRLSAGDLGVDLREFPFLEEDLAMDPPALHAWFDEYLQPYLKTIRVEEAESALDVYFPDGSVSRISYKGKDYLYCISANKLPDGINGKDCFIFGFYPNAPSWFDSAWFANLNCSDRVKYDNYANKGVEPYLPYAGWDHSRAALYEKGSYAKAIQLNNWTIPDDYPVGF